MTKLRGSMAENFLKQAEFIMKTVRREHINSMLGEGKEKGKLFADRAYVRKHCFNPISPPAEDTGKVYVKEYRHQT